MAGRGRPKGSVNKTTLIKSAETPKRSLEKIREIEPPERTEFYCCCCSKKYIKQKGNFTFSQSPLYKGNNSYLPICNSCIENLIEQYTEILGTQDEAIKRVCMHWDIYYNDSVLQSSRKTSADQSRFKNYIRHLNLSQNKSNTYDDYLMEESKKTIDTIEDIEQLNKDSEIKVKEKLVKFWGLGYKPEQYKYLQDEYNDWIARNEANTKAQQELFKALSISQLRIREESTTKGGKVKEAMETFQNLLGSANLKPTQTNDNALADQQTFGTLIKRWEDERPIPEPEPEWKDVDGIVKYISVYFLGHLCKMMNIKNSYSRMYEEEMAKYTVQKPEYEGDDEALFDAVFGGGLNGESNEEND